MAVSHAKIQESIVIRRWLTQMIFNEQSQARLHEYYTSYTGWLKKAEMPWIHVLHHSECTTTANVSQQVTFKSYEIRILNSTDIITTLKTKTQTDYTTCYQ